MKRNERIAAMTRILTANPNQIYTLTYFADMFDAAKSTISEDLVIMREVFDYFELGQFITVTGAAGGVKYWPVPGKKQGLEFVRALCRKLNEPERILPGGFLYMSDILADPATVQRMGEMLAALFVKNAPDFVLTIETRGIPVALMTARALGVPLVIARRDNRSLEGSLVTISYMSGSGKIETMSLARRAVSEGQRALIIDDFMHAGGSVKGLADLMREFSIAVVGTGIVMTMAAPQRKMVDNYVALMQMHELSDGTRRVEPAQWLVASEK